MTVPSVVGATQSAATTAALGTNQTMVHQAVVPASGTYWVQARTGSVTSAGWHPRDLLAFRTTSR